MTMTRSEMIAHGLNGHEIVAWNKRHMNCLNHEQHFFAMRNCDHIKALVMNIMAKDMQPWKVINPVTGEIRAFYTSIAMWDFLADHPTYEPLPFK